MFFKKFVKAMMSNAKYRSNPIQENLSEQKLVCLDIGAINAEQRRCFCDSLATGGDVQETKQGLFQSYGIVDKGSAIDILTWLKERGHRVYFNAIHMFVAGKDTGIIDNELDEDEAKETYDYINNLKGTIPSLEKEKIIESKDELCNISILAWDMGRLVLVARSCYDCGYIAEKEAWSFIFEAYKKSKAMYTDWDEFSTSYIIGRCMWGGNNMSLFGIIRIAKDLLNDEESPWQKHSLI